MRVLLITILLALPIILYGLGFYFNLPYVLGQPSPSNSQIWTMIGVFLGYAGVVFSFYAFFEISKLSDRHFAKARLPEIQKELSKITKVMIESVDKKALEIRSEVFLPQIPVMLRSLKRIKVNRFSKLTKASESNCKALNSWINQNTDNVSMIKESDDFWNLHRSLQEIIEEIKAYLEEEGARL